MKFWDASAVIPLCIDEPHTDTVHKIIKNDETLAVWWGTIIECYSAVSRLHRDGFLDNEEEGQVAGLLDVLSNSWTEIVPGDDIRHIAMRTLRNYPLRAADSLQLAAAIIWADKKPKGHQFVCFDTRLREAAGKEGFTVLPSRL